MDLGEQFQQLLQYLPQAEYTALILALATAGWQVLQLKWILIPLLILTGTAIATAVMWTSWMTILLAAVFVCFWSYMCWEMWWLVSMIWRKETTEAKEFPAARLYRHFGIRNYARYEGPKAAPPVPQPGEVTVVRTCRGTGQRLEEMATIKLEDAATAKEVPRESMIIIDPAIRYQKFTGFGTAFTESSGRVYQRVGKENKKRIIDAYFSKETGLGFNIGRLHMNSCDFSDGKWTCTPKEDDYELESFTTERYEEIMFPMVRLAQESFGEALILFASPWSPPDWLKDNGRMIMGGGLKQDEKSQKCWAQYYVRFAKELKEKGFPLFAYSVQNEPEAKTAWENCLYTVEGERDFVGDYLGPALEAAGMDVKILCWDHNRDQLLVRAQALYSDPKVEKYVWGMCWHWYGDPRYEWWPDRAGLVCWDNVGTLHDMRPDKHLWVSETCQECGPHIGDFNVAERYAEAIIRDFNNWTEAWVDWNLILDHTGGPNHVGNLCSAPLHADTIRNRLIFNPSYFAFGQFSRHIQPGAERILIGVNRDCLQATAFANPDGTLAIVVLNDSNYYKDICLRIGDKVARSNAPKHSITTFSVKL